MPLANLDTCSNKYLKLNNFILETKMKVLAFAASNSRKSINEELINYAATLLGKHEVDIVNINDYEMPI